MRSLRSSPDHPASALAVLHALLRRPVAPVRHALGYAADLRRRVIVNREGPKYVAHSMGLDENQVCGAVRLLRSGNYSPERLACVVMMDYGMDDEDIAGIFGRSVRWARVVREQADQIRKDEPIPAGLEYLDAGMCPGDPSPQEIYRHAKELRAARQPEPPRSDSYRPGIRMLSWRGDRGAFIPLCTA